MNIAPGWYGVAGTSDVRWWDGAKFRTILLRDGAVVYEKTRSQTPTMSYLLGGILVLLGLTRLAALSRDNVDVAFAVFLFIVGILSVISAALGRTVEKLPAPSLAPYADPRTMPWPGHTEPGPIAPGWYAAPSAKLPRWWTGARWSEYLLVRQLPLPVAGQRRRMVASKWIGVATFGLLSLLCLGLALVGASNGIGEMVAIGVILAVLFVVLAFVFAFYGAYMVRVYTLPTTPPGYNA